MNFLADTIGTSLFCLNAAMSLAQFKFFWTSYKKSNKEDTQGIA